VTARIEHLDQLENLVEGRRHRSNLACAAAVIKC